MSSSPSVKYEIKDRVAWVTINRPEVMNALSNETYATLDEVFLAASNDDDVLAIILTGEGGKAFCAGIDLKERTKLDSSTGSTTASINRVLELDLCYKPVIAAIDGYCLGGGLELALRCDIRIATKQSRFGLPEPRRSLLASYGLHNLSRIIPLGESLWMQLTGIPMTAQRAYEVSLIQTLLPDRDALFAEAERLGNEIKLCAPLAVQAIKRIVKIGRNLPVEYSQKLADPISEFIARTEDRVEGPKAFAEKRPPVWKSR